MEPSQKESLPPHISQCFLEMHWLVMNMWSSPAAFSHSTFVFIRLIRRSVRKRAQIHHVNFAAIALVFDMEHKSENLRMQLLRSPRVLIIDDIFVICLPLCESPCGSQQKPTTNFNFPSVLITEIVTCVNWLCSSKQPHCVLSLT